MGARAAEYSAKRALMRIAVRIGNGRRCTGLEGLDDCDLTRAGDHCCGAEKPSPRVHVRVADERAKRHAEQGGSHH